MIRNSRIARIGFSVCLGTSFLNGMGVTWAGWTTYRADNLHRGYVATSVDPTQFAEKWRRTITYNEADQIVADGRYVWASRNMSGHKIWAVEQWNVDTGTTLWRTEFDPKYNGIGIPAVANGRVYVNLESDSLVDGIPLPALFALDASSGSKLFQTAHEGQWFSGGQPVISNGRVFMPGGNYGGYDAYDATSGARLWFRPAEYDGGWVPAAVGDRVYVYDKRSGTTIARLLTHQGSNGNVIQEIPDVNADFTVGQTTTPVLDGNGHAFIRAQGYYKPPRLIGFDLRTGRVAWEKNIGLGELATNGTQLYGIEDRTIFHVLSPANGATLNSRPLPEPFFDYFVTDTHLFASTATSTLAINLTSWNIDWSTPVAGSLLLSSDTLLISNPGGVYAYAVIPEPDTLTNVLVLIVCGRLFRCGATSSARRVIPVSTLARNQLRSGYYVSRVAGK